ncbi:MAG TPA: glycosyl transferase, partial [Lachnospiraceae bacterium]|nr:glycosyl transferase [Lachnospiraceae bacterium]
MVTISLCMIVKNEEMHIARCLDSIAGLVEEIIIVDTGSTDRTVEIVSDYTSKVYS